MSKKNNKAVSISKKTGSDAVVKVGGFFSKHALLIVAMVASLVNLVVLIDYRSSPYSNFLLWDAANYWGWALQIAGGNLLGNSIYHQSPLYPYLLSVFVSLFGENPAPVYLFQAILSVLTSVTVYSIGLRISGSRIAALISGLMYALYGMQVFYATKVLSECVTAFIVVMTIRLLLSRRMLYSVVISGLFTGLLILVKPHFLMAVPFLIIYKLAEYKRYGLQKTIINCLFYLAVLSLVVSVVTIRNYYVCREFVLVSGNGGENFYIGNNKNANGTYVPVEGVSTDIAFQNEDVVSVARSQSGMNLTRSEVSKYWFDKGIEFISHEPLRYLKLELTKLIDIFSGAELTNMYLMGFEKRELTKTFGIAFVSFYMLFPFFCAGLAISLRMWRKNVLLYIMLVVNIASMLIFFYDTRFMVITMPCVILLSGSGLYRMASEIRKNGFIKKTFMQPLFIAFTAGIVLLCFIIPRDKSFPSQDWRMYMSLGDISYGLNDTDRSLEYYLKSSELNKTNCMPVLAACKAIFKKGNMDVAANLYNSTIRTAGSDVLRTVLRDRDFDALREYAASQK